MSKSLLSPSFDELLEAQLDITAPKQVVQVTWNSEGTTLWVNVDGACVLRICRIPRLEVLNFPALSRFEVSEHDPRN